MDILGLIGFELELIVLLLHIQFAPILLAGIDESIEGRQEWFTVLLCYTL